MIVGPFTLTGGYNERHVDTLRRLLARPGPWHVLLTRPWTIHFDPSYRTLAGIVRGETINIWGPYEDDGHSRGGTSWALAHEIGHAVDSTIFRPCPEMRNTIHEAMHDDAGDHLRLTADLPWPKESGHAPHGWSGSGRTDHDDAGGEAFAEWFAWWVGTHGRTSYGRHHAWDTDVQQAAIERIVMDATDQVKLFSDQDDISATHKANVLRAAALGIVTVQDPPGPYDPKEPVTREQMATYAVQTYDAAHG